MWRPHEGCLEHCTESGLICSKAWVCEEERADLLFNFQIFEHELITVGFSILFKLCSEDVAGIPRCKGDAILDILLLGGKDIDLIPDWVCEELTLR